MVHNGKWIKLKTGLLWKLKIVFGWRLTVISLFRDAFQ